MKFSVTLRKEGAPDQTRVVDAVSRFAVYDQIEKEGGVVINLQEGETGFTLPAWLLISIGTRVGRSEIIRTAKNLSVMLSAGLSLSRALSVIERQTSNARLKEVVVGLSESVRRGSSFHEALASYPKVFSAEFVAMAKAGEESGSLAASLTVIALQMEHAEELMRKIRGAMVYPAIVITTVVVVGILMLIYVVPTLTSTFNELGVQVPFLTRIIVALSNFLVANILFVSSAFFLLLVGAVAFYRSKFGSRLTLAVALHLPVVGELIRETYAARASRTLSSLLSAGVPVLEALSITQEVVHAEAFAKVVGEAGERVKKGELLSASFTEHTQLYPILMSEMLAVGEETGKVAEMLKQVAEFYEEDAAAKTKNISSIVEPVLMLLIGAVVGIFAISMIAPIYSLSGAF